MSPSILIIPGAWGLPESFDVIVNAVKAEGYEIRALRLPSVATGPIEGTPPTMYDDAAFIAKETEKLADEGKDVVLIAHSYGGFPMSQSTKGLGKEDREKNGKNGGIVRLAYMTALVPILGSTVRDMLAELPTLNIKTNVWPPLARCLMNLFDMQQEQGWLYDGSITDSAMKEFLNLSKEEVESLAEKILLQSAASFVNKLTHHGYKDFPVSYLVCEEDPIILEVKQLEYIELIEKESGRIVDVTSIRTGHVPNATAPDKFIDWVLEVAKRVENLNLSRD